MIKKVLVGMGGTPYSLVAIKRGVEMARLHQAQARAVTVVNTQKLRNVGSVPIGAVKAAQDLGEQRVKETREGIEKAIAFFESECRKADICYDVVREEGDEFGAFIHQSRYFDVSIIGLRGLFDYGVINDPENKVLRLFQMGMRPFIATSEKFRAIKKVLIAYGGSYNAAKSMQRFVQLRLWEEMEIRIACFHKPEGDPSAILEDAAQYCFAHGYTVETFFRDEDPVDGVMNFAREWDADMIVLGDSTRSTLRRKIFGSTTINTIKQAQRPLFLS